MTLVVAPNGATYDLAESVASGLVGSVGSGWTVAPAPKTAPVSKK